MRAHGFVEREYEPGFLDAANLPSLATSGTPIIDQTQPASPGQLESHYAPNHHLRLNITDPADDEAFIGFGPVMGPCKNGAQALNLSLSGDLQEAAANLFDMLHAADAIATAGIAIAPIPETGLGEAINDRLMRAAAPRP